MRTAREKELEKLYSFWQLIGYKRKETTNWFHEPIVVLVAPNGCSEMVGEPQMNMTNLMKLTVPFLRNLSETNCLQDIEFHYQGVNICNRVTCNLIFDDAEYEGEGDDETEAMKMAIERVFEAR